MVLLLGVYLKRPFIEVNVGPEHEIFRVPAGLKAVAVAGLEKRKTFVGMSSRAGITIVAGTDGPGIGRLSAGFGLHYELALLVEAGLPPLDAIRAATLDAARALRRENELGTIEAGKYADLIVLSENPLEDIRKTSSIDAVVVRGRILERAALDRLLDQLETDARKDH